MVLKHDKASVYDALSLNAQHEYFGCMTLVNLQSPHTVSTCKCNEYIRDIQIEFISTPRQNINVSVLRI